MSDQLRLHEFNIGKATPLEFIPLWPDKVHQFSKEEAMAIAAAFLAERPLLIEGPPGSGKSQIAAAAAAVLGRELITYVVNSNTEPADLLWRYDALRRLNDAQADGELKPDEAYLQKGPLWQAFENDDSEDNIENSIDPYVPENFDKEGSGKVVLIDEIDKADRSVPNSLLEVFGHRRFKCPHLNTSVPRENRENKDAPLVIITSNREQQLPPAFVRRCLVLRIALPTEETEFVKKLAERAEMHFDDQLTLDQYKEVAKKLWEARDQSGLPEELQPGQAEYFDLIRAISKILDLKMEDEFNNEITFEKLLVDLEGLTFDKANTLDT